MSVLKIAVASVLALSLVLGLALPALADSGEPLPWAGFKARIVKGEVSYVDQEDQAYFDVQSGEDELTINVDENTRYFILGAPGRLVALAQQLRIRDQEEVGAPAGQGLGLGLQSRARTAVQEQARLRVQDQLCQAGNSPMPEPQLAWWSRWSWCRPFGAGAGFGDIEVGDRVVVWLADGDNLARAVLIVKPATRAIVSGTITDVGSETIEITPDGGEAVTLDYNEDTVFVLDGFTSVEEGQLARAVYDSGSMLALRVMVYLPD
jgi:DNA-binding beta-propeller fold protein YncE